MSLEQLVGTEYKSLNGISKRLFEQMVELVEPGADNRDFQAAKPDVMAASNALRARYEPKEVDGVQAVYRFEYAANGWNRVAKMDP